MSFRVVQNEFILIATHDQIIAFDLNENAVTNTTKDNDDINELFNVEQEGGSKINKIMISEDSDLVLVVHEKQVSLIKYNPDDGFSTIETNGNYSFDNQIISVAVNEEMQKIFISVQTSVEYHQCNIVMIKYTENEGLEDHFETLVRDVVNMTGLHFYKPQKYDFSNQKDYLNSKSKEGWLFGQQELSKLMICFDAKTGKHLKSI